MSQNHANIIFDRVKEAGATADLIIDQKESLSLKANKGKLEEHTVSSTRVFGLRVIKDGQVGTAYSESDDQDSLKSIVDQALINASFTAPEEHERILENNQTLATDDAHFCPQDDSTIDQKIALILELESQLAAKDKIKAVPYNGLSESLFQRQIFSTAGLNASSKARHFVLYASALAEAGDKNAMEGDHQVTRLCSELDTQKMVDKAYADCLAMLEGKAIPSKHYDVIFSTDCQSSLFGVFSMILSGKAAKDGINPWRDKLSQTVADKRLSLSDKPRLIDGFGYELFDAEGTATATTPLIQNGQLESFLHNSVTASHFGLKSTGHATRGPKSSLALSSHQLVIEPGSENQTTLTSGEYLELTDLSGMHSGANAISGDFSFGASGYLCRDGQRLQAVRGVTVAGNFYEMLNKIESIGDTQHWTWQKSSLMPQIRFSKMAISGE